jgi:hypothetical protein
LTHLLPEGSERNKRLLASLITLGIMLPGVSLTMNGSLFAANSPSASSLTPSLTVVTQDTTGAPLTGYYVALFLAGLPVSSGYTPVTFTLVGGVTYVVESDGYGSCVFDHWRDTGSTDNQRAVSITSDTTLTSVLNCGSSTTTTTTTTTSTTAINSTTSTSLTTSTTSTASTTSVTSTTSTGSAGITVYAHRIPASYWDACFATTCTNPYAPCDTSCTGPGTTMYFALYDSAGNFLTGGFADENGFTFTGLTPGATYYVYPDDCNMCHGSVHDVVFEHWADGSTVRPIAAMVGQSLDAWYSCTNNCA